jgi:hypothetical protein
MFLVETFLLKKKSFRLHVRKFLQRYPVAIQPSKTCFLKLFNKGWETSSIHDKKKWCPKHALAEQRLDDIQVRMEMGPKKCSYQLGQKCGISKSSVLWCLRCHLYKVSVIQKLIPADPAVCTNVCNWMLQSVHSRIVDLILVFLSNSAWLHHSGFVNAQSTHHSGTKNLHTIHEVPLNDHKVGVRLVRE